MANGFNFSRTPFENERLPRLVFSLTAAMVLGVTVVHGVLLARHLVREQEALDIQVAELRDELDAIDAEIQRTEASLSQQQTALGNERTSFLTRVYRYKSFSWTGLFNELETITPPAVRVTSIAPFEEDGEIAVTMSVVGRTLADVLEMVRALEASSFFATVFPLEEVDLADRAGSDTGIAATLRLQYVGDAKPEPAVSEPEDSGVAEPEDDLELDPEPETDQADPIDSMEPDDLVPDDVMPNEVIEDPSEVPPPMEREP